MVKVRQYNSGENNATEWRVINDDGSLGDRVDDPSSLGEDTQVYNKYTHKYGGLEGLEGTGTKVRKYNTGEDGATEWRVIKDDGSLGDRVDDWAALGDYVSAYDGERHEYRPAYGHGAVLGFTTEGDGPTFSLDEFLADVSLSQRDGLEAEITAIWDAIRNSPDEATFDDLQKRLRLVVSSVALPLTYTTGAGETLTQAEYDSLFLSFTGQPPTGDPGQDGDIWDAARRTEALEANRDFLAEVEAYDPATAARLVQTLNTDGPDAFFAAAGILLAAFDEDDGTGWDDVQESLPTFDNGAYLSTPPEIEFAGGDGALLDTAEGRTAKPLYEGYATAMDLADNAELLEAGPEQAAYPDSLKLSAHAPGINPLVPTSHSIIEGYYSDVSDMALYGANIVSLRGLQAAQQEYGEAKGKLSDIQDYLELSRWEAQPSVVQDPQTGLWRTDWQYTKSDETAAMEELEAAKVNLRAAIGLTSLEEALATALKEMEAAENAASPVLYTELQSGDRARGLDPGDLQRLNSARDAVEKAEGDLERWALAHNIRDPEPLGGGKGWYRPFRWADFLSAGRTHETLTARMVRRALLKKLRPCGRHKISSRTRHQPLYSR